MSESEKTLNWMIYGAYGYTGKLVIKRALENGHKPIVAGRHPQKIADLAQEFGLPGMVFDITEGDSKRFLDTIDILVNCAGPFSQTVAPTLEACIESKTHYLDITGEIEVFEHVHGLDEKIKEAGIAAIPGVGFDVVPSDCLAAMLKGQLPEAENLVLAFHPGRGETSPGTTKTMIENLHKGGKVRRDGKICSVTTAYKTKIIPFTHKSSLAVTIPWGDVSTAYYSTKIPNIEVYIGIPKSNIRALKLMRLGRFLFKFKPLTTYAMHRASKIKGPDQITRDSGRCYLYGEASAGDKKVEMKIETPEGYKLTALTTVAAVEAMIKSLPKPGALTPSMAFGAEFIKSIPGVN
jgi:short subunit dehydrogenase-like uncharacterized protein